MQDPKVLDFPQERVRESSDVPECVTQKARTNSCRKRFGERSDRRLPEDATLTHYSACSNPIATSIQKTGPSNQHTNHRDSRALGPTEVRTAPRRHSFLFFLVWQRTSLLRRKTNPIGLAGAPRDPSGSRGQQQTSFKWIDTVAGWLLSLTSHSIQANGSSGSVNLVTIWVPSCSSLVDTVNVAR